MTDHRNDAGDNDSRRPAVVGLIVVAVLVVAAYYLVMSLRDSGRMQDCLASGRTNCAPIDTPAPSR